MPSPENLEPVNFGPAALEHPLVAPEPDTAAPGATRLPRRQWSKRRLWLALCFVLVTVAAMALLLYLRKQAPPEPARLLPEADAILYANLKPARLAYLSRHPIPPSSDYAAFQQATGITLERDLDEMAFAVHVLGNPIGGQGPFGFSEVFTGHFDEGKLQSYFASVASGQEDYGGHTIYAVPHEGRVVRCAILGSDMVAASNMPTPEQIHHIVDASRSSVLPFGGPSLLRDNYSDVPLLSFAWGIGRISAPFSNHGNFTLYGIRLPIPANATFVASARALTAIHLRVEEIAPTESTAAASASAVRGLISLVNGEQKISATLTGTRDPDMTELLQSIAVEQKKDRAVLTVSVPFRLARRLAEPKR